MKNFKNGNFLNSNKIANRTTNPFIQILNETVCNGELSDEAYRTLGVLLTFKISKNPTFPSLKSIALKRHRSINSISTHIKELKRLEIISYKKRGYSQSNEYFFNFTIGCDNETSKINHIATNSESIYRSTSKNTTNTLGSNNTNRNIENNNKDLCSGKEMQEKLDSIREKLSFLSQKNNNVIIK